jgi:hypothetical protein
MVLIPDRFMVVVPSSASIAVQSRPVMTCLRSPARWCSYDGHGQLDRSKVQMNPRPVCPEARMSRSSSSTSLKPNLRGTAALAAFASSLGNERVEIRTDQANAASAAVPRKLGFRLVLEEDRDILEPVWSGPSVKTSTSNDFATCDFSQHGLPLTVGLESGDAVGNDGVHGLPGGHGLGPCPPPVQLQIARLDGSDDLVEIVGMPTAQFNLTRLEPIRHQSHLRRMAYPSVVMPRRLEPRSAHCPRISADLES